VTGRGGRVVAFVEGKGEMDAVPTLVHRVVARYHPSVPPPVVRPLRVHRDALLGSPEEWDRCTQLAQAFGPTGLLVLLDADDDCAAQKGPALQAELQRRCGSLPVQVVFAVREYECWFLAALDSVRAVLRLAPSASAPPEPEQVRGAKEYLARLMPRHTTYRPTVDQKRRTAALDLEAARTASPSFDKLCRAVGTLLTT
jgi:hypothetical protein